MNFFGVASLATAATSGLPGLWMATRWSHVVDDLALAAVVCFAVAWYVRSPFRRSAVPFVCLVTGFLIKLGGVSLAGGHDAASAADATVAAFFASALIVTAWRSVTTARAAARAARLRAADLLIDALRERGYGPSSTPSV